MPCVMWVPMPSAVTTAEAPIRAFVVLVTTGTATPAPMAAVPPTEMLPAMTNRFIDSSAETITLPPARTSAPEPTVADVVTLMTGTAALTVTAAVPPTETPAEIDLRSSEDVDITTTSPLARTVLLEPIEADVFLCRSSTSSPTPTPAVPPTAMAPARDRMVVVSVALTTTAWKLLPLAFVQLRPEQLILALEPMLAVVVSVRTSTTTEPAMPAVSPPAPATATSSRLTFCVAATVSPATVSPVAPSASTSADPATEAVTLPLRTRTTTAAPTPALLALMATFPEAMLSLSAMSEAVTDTSPPACTTALPPMVAEVAWSPALMMMTATVPTTAALLVDPLPPTTISSRFSVEVAVTSTLPPALTFALLPMLALTSLVRTMTMIEPATDAEPPLRARPPETSTIEVPSLAATFTDWLSPPVDVWLICALSPM